VEIDVPAGETRYSRVQLPVNGSIELVYVIEGSGGRGDGYISKTSENPNSALFDFSFAFSEVRHCTFVKTTKGLSKYFYFICFIRKTCAETNSLLHCDTFFAVVESFDPCCVVCHF